LPGKMKNIEIQYSNKQMERLPLEDSYITIILTQSEPVHIISQLLKPKN
jgi:hypothetical protein